ncbi:MAG: succinate dehydrogenase assembly factor 4 [Halofilum sp. (in: g-proteobacteria)]
MTESNSRAPADSDAPESPEHGDRRSDARERPEATPKSGEAGGPKGLEPTRYGDWERNGRCTDF